MRKTYRDSTSGFALVELIVVLGVVSVLVSLVTVNLLRPQQQSALTASVDTLVSDLKQAQTKAMAGVGGSHHGAYVGQDSYVLFSGTNYNANDSANAQVALGSNISVASVTLPGRQIVFAPGSGEIVNFNPATNSITIGNTQSGEQQTMEFNRYGTITNIY